MSRAPGEFVSELAATAVEARISEPGVIGPALLPVAWLLGCCCATSPFKLFVGPALLAGRPGGKLVCASAPRGTSVGTADGA